MQQRFLSFRAIAELCFVIAAVVVVITVLHSRGDWPSLLLKVSHLLCLWPPILQLFHKRQLFLSMAHEKSLLYREMLLIMLFFFLHTLSLIIFTDDHGPSVLSLTSSVQNLLQATEYKGMILAKFHGGKLKPDLTGSSGM